MKARLHTRQISANDAARRWALQYPTSKLDIRKELEALGPTPNPDDVDRVIGNGSWTGVPSCGGCERSGLTAVVEVGEEQNYDTCTAYLCGQCLQEALEVLQTCSAQLGDEKGNG